MKDFEKLTAGIRAADSSLQEKFGDSLSVNYDLDRKLVSYQADKTERVSRWCQYREGFRLL